MATFPSMEIDERARVVVFVVPQKMSSVKRYSKILIIYLAAVVLEFWRPGQNREIIEDVFEDYYGTRIRFLAGDDLFVMTKMGDVGRAPEMVITAVPSTSSLRP